MLIRLVTIRAETIITAGSGVGGLKAIPDGGRDRPPEVQLDVARL